MYIQLEYSGELLELKNTDEKKWRGNISLPLAPLSLPQLPSLFIPAHFSFRASWEQRPLDVLPIIVKATLFWEFVSLETIAVKRRAAKKTYIE